MEKIGTIFTFILFHKHTKIVNNFKNEFIVKYNSYIYHTTISAYSKNSITKEIYQECEYNFQRFFDTHHRKQKITGLDPDLSRTHQGSQSSCGNNRKIISPHRDCLLNHQDLSQKMLLNELKNFRHTIVSFTRVIGKLNIKIYTTMNRSCYHIYI
jgi:hypothetical protein